MTSLEITNSAGTEEVFIAQLKTSAFEVASADGMLCESSKFNQCQLQHSGTNCLLKIEILMKTSNRNSTNFLFQLMEVAERPYCNTVLKKSFRPFFSNAVSYANNRFEIWISVFSFLGKAHIYS